MLRVLSTKILLTIPTLVGIVLISFIFIRALPGDPVLLLSGERGISDERRAELLAKLGLDQPWYIQFIDYVGKVLKGDFGDSIATHRPVVTEFFDLFPATVELGLTGLFLAVLIGIPLGVLSALKKGTIVDHSLMSISLVGYSMPIFWWGLLCIVFFAGFLGWFPVSGRISVEYYIPAVTGFMLIDSLITDEPGAFISVIRHLALPSFVLSTVPLVVIARQTRSAIVEVLEENYILAAKAKGFSAFRVLFIHALRNAMIIIITVVGLQTGLIITGAILTETIFSWPGIGKWMVYSIYRRDYPAVQGGLFFIASFVMIINLLVDFTYTMINPRLRK